MSLRLFAPTFSPEPVSKDQAKVVRQIKLLRLLDGDGAPLQAVMSHAEVGKVLGIGRQRVAQIEQRALRKLRKLARRVGFQP